MPITNPHVLKDELDDLYYKEKAKKMNLEEIIAK